MNWVQSEDGSYTAYSEEYDEHYHSTKDGALNESLKKHVEPAFLLHLEKEELRIIDICFGLGFNTLSTLYYRDLYFPNTSVEIYSPELNGELVSSLVSFPYPDIFEPYTGVISDLCSVGGYEDERTRITVEITDARKAMGELGGIWDVCYQDAFSPSVNPVLWTKEYFSDIAKLLGNEGILTTYSTAFSTRMALYENNMNVYLNSGKGFRNATIATRRNIEEFEKIDMEHKIATNPGKGSLKDETAGQ